MSKLNVDEIESNTTNSNVKVIVKNSDSVCEIKGATNDGTLQLNCSAQSHGVKLKAPSSSAGQNYTMILPDNQIAANKLLKVKSVTNNVGQLEYADIPSQDLTNLDAANLTSGTVPSARFPSTGFAAKGTGLKFVSKQTVGSTAVSSITFTGLENDTMYKMVAKHIQTDNSTSIDMQWLDSNGTPQSSIRYEYYYYAGNSPGAYRNLQRTRTGSNITDIQMLKSGTKGCFVADFSNIPANNWMVLTYYRKGNTGSKYEAFASFDNSDDTLRIHGIKIIPNNTSRNIIEGTEILLYKYIET